MDEVCLQVTLDKSVSSKKNIDIIKINALSSSLAHNQKCNLMNQRKDEKYQKTRIAVGFEFFD